MHRVLNLEPDLGPLDGALRDLVSACLAKDPRRRPSARHLLDRLLDLPAAPAFCPLPPPAPPVSGEQTIVPPPLKEPGTGLTRRRALGALGAVLAMTAGSGGLMLANRPDGPPDLPGLEGGLVPDPGGPVELTSYTDSAVGHAYVADRRSGAFERTRYWLAVVSPKRRYVAAVPTMPENTRHLNVLDRDTRREQTVDLGRRFMAPQWAPGGGRLLVTLLDEEDLTRATGFAIITVDGDRHRITPVPVNEPTVGWLRWRLYPGAFAWDRQGKGVVAASLEGNWPDKRLTRYDLTGRPLASLPPTGPNVGTPYSPDGRHLAVQHELAESDGGSVRIYDPKGGLVRQLDLPAARLAGWYDATHVIVYTFSGDTGQTRVVGIDGTPGRVLITNGGKPQIWNLTPYFSPRIA